MTLRSMLIAGTTAAILAATGPMSPAAADIVAISTLPPGAINNVQAQAIAKVAQENSGLQMRVATFNAPSAIIGAAQNKQAEFAFTSNDESWAAFSGRDEYRGRPMKDLRIALTVFPFQVGLIVRKDSNIKTVCDLKGKRMATGWQGMLQGVPLFNGKLANCGLSLDDAVAVPATNILRAADDFKAGKSDVFIFAVGGPKVAEIHSAVGGIRFLNFDNSPGALKRMQAVRPQYHMAVVNPAPHLPGIEGPTNLMQYYIVVLTNKNVADDTVYTLVKALHPHKAELVKAHPSYNNFDGAKMAVPHAGLEYHPGAIKFYKEIGIWPAK